LRTRVSAAVHFSFVRTLVAGAETGRSYTVIELAERFEIAQSTAWKWMRMLREGDLVYIKEWRRVGKVPVACFAFGFKEDSVPKPLPLTQEEHERNYRERKRQLAKLRRAPLTAMVGHLT